MWPPHWHPKKSPFPRQPPWKGEESGAGNTLEWAGLLRASVGFVQGTHLPLPEDVPEQRQVLCSEVPKRPDAPAMADGDQVQVIEL